MKVEIIFLLFLTTQCLNPLSTATKFQQIPLSTNANKYFSQFPDFRTSFGFIFATTGHPISYVAGSASLATQTSIAATIKTPFYNQFSSNKQCSL